MILIIDNYDSFTYNLVQLVERLGYPCRVFYNDELSIDEIKRLNPDKIIISPGPGTPDDAGVSKDVIKNFHTYIPILGVCLGHEAIGVSFGAELVHAKTIMHGKISEIRHTDRRLFKDVPPLFEAARYHSLAIDNIKLPLRATAWSRDGTIMALEHTDYPLYGVQFHPESFMTPAGETIIKNFLK